VNILKKMKLNQKCSKKKSESLSWRKKHRDNREIKVVSILQRKVLYKMFGAVDTIRIIRSIEEDDIFFKHDKRVTIRNVLKEIKMNQKKNSAFNLEKDMLGIDFESTEFFNISLDQLYSLYEKYGFILAMKISCFFEGEIWKHFEDLTYFEEVSLNSKDVEKIININTFGKNNDVTINSYNFKFSLDQINYMENMWGVSEVSEIICLFEKCERDYPKDKVNLICKIIEKIALESQ